MEASSRLKIDVLVNNTNVAYDTTVEMLVNGQKIVEDAAKALKIPVNEIGAMSEIIEKLPKEFIEKYESIIVPINLYMRKDWMGLIASSNVEK